MNKEISDILNRDACQNGFDHTKKQIMDFMLGTTAQGCRKLLDDLTVHYGDLLRIEREATRRGDK